MLVSLGIWAFYQGDSTGHLITQVKAKFNETILNYDETSNQTQDQESLNFFQAEFQCCGWDTYSDWSLSPQLNQLKPYLRYKFLLSLEQIEINVPDTCCRTVKESCGKDYSLNKKIYLEGCEMSVVRLLSHLKNFVFFVTCGLSASFMLAGVFYSLVITVIGSEYNVFYLVKFNVNKEEKKRERKEQEEEALMQKRRQQKKKIVKNRDVSEKV